MKTYEQVEALKKQWLDDPCYDLECTPGFEEHVNELRNFRLNREAERTEAHKKRLEEKAKLIGVPGNLNLAAYVECLEDRIEDLCERICKLEGEQ